MAVAGLSDVHPHWRLDGCWVTHHPSLALLELASNNWFSYRLSVLADCLISCVLKELALTPATGWLLSGSWDFHFLCILCVGHFSSAERLLSSWWDAQGLWGGFFLQREDEWLSLAIWVQHPVAHEIFSTAMKHRATPFSCSVISAVYMQYLHRSDCSSPEFHQCPELCFIHSGQSFSFHMAVAREKNCRAYIPCPLGDKNCCMIFLMEGKEIGLIFSIFFVSAGWKALVIQKQCRWFSQWPVRASMCC